MIKLQRYDDYEILYINQEKVLENHKLSASEILRCLSKKLDIHYQEEYIESED